MLLERADATAEEAVTRLVGMQAQAPYAPYFGLWSRLRKFGTADLTDALTKRRLVRVALMRSTVHLVTTADYRSLRPWAQPALDREPERTRVISEEARKRVMTRMRAPPPLRNAGSRACGSG
jgi:hypothetical protein